LKTHQRQQIRSVRFEGYVDTVASGIHSRHWRSSKMTFAQFFPALERLEVLVYGCSSSDIWEDFEGVEEYLHKQLKLLSRGSSCEVTVKQVETPPVRLFDTFE
jgi:hypothetical protein